MRLLLVCIISIHMVTFGDGVEYQRSRRAGPLEWEEQESVRIGKAMPDFLHQMDSKFGAWRHLLEDGRDGANGDENLLVEEPIKAKLEVEEGAGIAKERKKRKKELSLTLTKKAGVRSKKTGRVTVRNGGGEQKVKDSKENQKLAQNNPKEAEEEIPRTLAEIKDKMSRKKFEDIPKAENHKGKEEEVKKHTVDGAKDGKQKSKPFKDELLFREPKSEDGGKQVKREGTENTGTTERIELEEKWDEEFGELKEEYRGNIMGLQKLEKTNNEITMEPRQEHTDDAHVEEKKEEEISRTLAKVKDKKSRKKFDEIKAENPEGKEVEAKKLKVDGAKDRKKKSKPFKDELLVREPKSEDGDKQLDREHTENTGIGERIELEKKWDEEFGEVREEYQGNITGLEKIEKKKNEIIVKQKQHNTGDAHVEEKKEKQKAKEERAGKVTGKTNAEPKVQGKKNSNKVQEEVNIDRIEKQKPEEERDGEWVDFTKALKIGAGKEEKVEVAQEVLKVEKKKKGEKKPTQKLEDSKQVAQEVLRGEKKSQKKQDSKQDATKDEKAGMKSETMSEQGSVEEETVDTKSSRSGPVVEEEESEKRGEEKEVSENDVDNSEDTKLKSEQKEAVEEKEGNQVDEKTKLEISLNEESKELEKVVKEEVEPQVDDVKQDRPSESVDLDVTSGGTFISQPGDAEDDEYSDFMQEFAGLPSKLQETAENVASHLRPDLQRWTDKSKVYFNIANEQITESFSPLIGRQYAPFLASLISYALLLLPLALVIILFEHIRALLSLEKVLLFVNIYLAAYFATLLLATFIIGTEPMAFFHKNALSSYIYLQLLQALGYIVYLVLQIFNVMGSCSSDTIIAKLTALLQLVVAVLVGLHYYITVFHRAMATKPPRTSWKIYGIYCLAFFILCLFARIKRHKKEYAHLGDGSTDKKN